MSELHKKHQESKEVIDNTRKVRRASLNAGETPTFQEETPRNSGQPKKRRTIDITWIREEAVSFM